MIEVIEYPRFENFTFLCRIVVGVFAKIAVSMNQFLVCIFLFRLSYIYTVAYYWIACHLQIECKSKYLLSILKRE